MTFYFYKITRSKLNYNIFNKELFIVVEALYKWRVYLKETKYSI